MDKSGLWDLVLMEPDGEARRLVEGRSYYECQGLIQEQSMPDPNRIYCFRVVRHKGDEPQ